MHKEWLDLKEELSNLYSAITLKYNPVKPLIEYFDELLQKENARDFDTRIISDDYEELVRF